MVHGEPSGQSNFPKLELPIFLDMDYEDSTKKTVRFNHKESTKNGHRGCAGRFAKYHGWKRDMRT
jgi:hypothetical protein